MRKLIVQQWTTIDTIVAEEDGGLSFVTAKPFNQSTDEDFKASALSFIDTVDTMILGAHTYAMTKDYWTTTVDEGIYGEKLNQLTKFVASKKMTEAPWGSFPAATVISDPVSAVREMKQQGGKNIWLWGSLTLMKSMFEADLVDEVQMRVCPTTRGKGIHLFNDQRSMDLIEAKSFKNGVVLLRYAVKR